MSQRLLAQLLSSSRQDREDLVALMARQAAPQAIIEQAHKIKGAARIVQASALAAQCEALELACARNEERPTIDMGVKALEKLMLELERTLQVQLHKLDSQ